MCIGRLLSFSILLMMSHCLSASQLNTTKLKIVTEHYPPYQELSKHGKIAGFSTEIVRAALKHTDIDYHMQIYPWSRSYALAKERANTCIYSMERNEAREQIFQWIAPIVEVNDFFVGLSNRTDIKLNTIEDVKNYKVAVLRDDRTHHLLLSMGFVENKNLYVINNTYSMLQLLLTQKSIDLVLADTINIEYRAKFNKIDPNLSRSYMKLNTEIVQLQFACNLETSAPVIRSLKDAFKTIKSNGEYQAILDKWYDN